MDLPATKRQADGLRYAEIVIGILKGVPPPERKEYLHSIIDLIDNYKFSSRKEQDPIHYKSKDDSWKNIPTSEKPDGLLNLLFEPLETGYNSTRLNRIREVMLDKLKEYFFENYKK